MRNPVHLVLQRSWVERKWTHDTHHVELTNRVRWDRHPRKWYVKLLIWLFEKSGLGTFRIQQHYNLTYHTMTLDVVKLQEQLAHQIEELTHHNLRPAFVVMGHKDFRSFLALDPEDLRAIGFDRPYSTPEIGMEWRKQVRVPFYTDPYLTQQRVADTIRTELRGATHLVEEPDHINNTRLFTGHYAYGLPIYVLPWLQGMFVVPTHK